MSIQQRLARLEQMQGPDLLSRLTNAELLEQARGILTPDVCQTIRLLAGTVRSAPAFVIGMNLGSLDDAQLCAVFLKRAA